MNINTYMNVIAILEVYMKNQLLLSVIFLTALYTSSSFGMNVKAAYENAQQGGSRNPHFNPAHAQAHAAQAAVQSKQGGSGLSFDFLTIKPSGQNPAYTEQNVN